ncbi:hypothetical protein LWC34_45565 [Kibdelosporangium philippinense]|uniref:TIR domain-containing protein n=1 Tax=Kibdelosporangium philippinense TaxID=211113 RepID=A0ABS8ZR30_9PSEU|nr:hypothetical protein [Kibdelosporangium philippinense]MCE7010029.1 hypothetical protein [Kibdelosporangium philippinense]
MAEDQLITQHDLFVVTANDERFGAPSAQRAHSAVNELRHRFPGSNFSWMLSPDAPAPAEFCGRYRRLNGLAESQRVAHLFLLTPGFAITEATVLTTLCGASIRADILEILPGLANGMPCYSCLALIPTPDGPRAEIDQGTSALTELGQRHTEPRWPEVDGDPGPDTPIARAVWADITQKQCEADDPYPVPVQSSPPSAPPDNDWFSPVVPSPAGLDACGKSSCSQKGEDVSGTQWYG